MIYWYFQIEVFRFWALFFSFLSRGLENLGSCMLDNQFTTELHPQSPN